MKIIKKLTCILIVLLSLSTLYAQRTQGKIIYKGSMNMPFDVKKSNASTLGSINDIMSKKNDVEFELLFSQKEALYKLKSVLDTEDFKLKIAQIMLGGNNIHYTNTKTNESFYQIDVYGESFIVIRNKIDWILSKETKKIGKYVCLKATTYKIVENSKGVFKHNVIAWYTNEIPVNFGPNGHYGLPGLILELQEQNNNFVAIKIDFNLESNLKIKKPKKGKVVSQKEFDEIGEQMSLSRGRQN